jgi:hypothetical protein
MKEQAHQMAQLHDNVPSFLIDAKFARHRVLELQLRGLEPMQEYEVNLTQVIRGTFANLLGNRPFPVMKAVDQVIRFFLPLNACIFSVGCIGLPAASARPTQHTVS